MAATRTKCRGRWSAIPAFPRPGHRKPKPIAARRSRSSRNRSPISPELRRAMAKTMKHADAVLVGMGWTGSIMARELTKAGLSVVGLERGANRSPAQDFALPGIRDELKYRLRFQLVLDNGTETITMRHTPDEAARPMRRWGAFPLGDGVGRAGTHRNGVTCRNLPSEFVLRSHLDHRYGKKALPADLTIQDWGVTYDGLE